MTHHEHVATVDSVATIRRAEGTYVSDVPAHYHLATRHAATLTPTTTYATLTNQHAAWAPDQAVTAGTKRAHAGHLYECVQPHTTQADWTPTLTPALWNRIPAAGVAWKWTQPLGAHDALPLGFVVRHKGSEWESLVANNVWEPGTNATLWRDLNPPPPEEYPAWKPWTGINADLYKVGDKVTHKGQRWESTTPNNHWEPGVFGWKVIP